MEHRTEVTDETGAVTASKEIIAKIRKVLELAKRGGTEGETAAAAHRLNELLTKYNLQIADLELRTGKVAAVVGQQGYDLEKAGFKWKLDLADYIADHYYCAPVVDRKAKTVVFVGRPDNVESLRMLYGWLIDQIKRLATEERRVHIERTGEHVDPLRWQLGFGEGAAMRLSERLTALRQSQFDSSTTALVLHHSAEVNDYLEDKFGYRRDGKRTKRDQAWHDNYDKTMRERADLLASCQKSGNMEPYYTRYPWLRPLTPEQQTEKDKRDRADQKRIERNRKRREAAGYRYRPERDETPEERRQRRQRSQAKTSGIASADRINLQPFLDGATDKKKVKGED